MSSPIARLGDISSHGGTITTVFQQIVTDEGKLVAQIGSLHSCPIDGHGVTPIQTGSEVYKINGIGVARVGDSAGCGAVISSGSLLTKSV